LDSIPIHLQTEFEAILRNKSVPIGFHIHYKKWLRFYLDFCRKYGFRENERISLDHFLMKLHEKKQTKAQQQQASHAIALYYEIVHERDARHANAPPSPKSTLSLMTSTEPEEDNNPLDNIHKTSQNMKVAERITTIPAKADVEPSPSEKPATGMSWKEEYTRLSNEIQVRHYSQKTLRPSHIPFVTVLPAICFKPILIFARFRNCLDIAMSEPP